MTGFDFDEAFRMESQPAHDFQEFRDGEDVLDKDGARAFLTEALEAVAHALKYQGDSSMLHRDAAVRIARALIPKPPAPPDLMAEYVRRLEQFAESIRQRGGEEHGTYCDCYPCQAACVLASKPKEAQP